MPSFPTSVYNPASKATGDTIQAAHVNNLDAEVNAIEDGYVNGTARLNSSNSTLANLSVTGGSTFTGGVVFGSTMSFASSVTCRAGLNVSSGAGVFSSGVQVTGSTSSFGSSVTVSSGGLTVSSGGIVVSTGVLTLGQGAIAFPATQVAAAGANTLDDYEEGTWTPVIGGSGGTSGQSYTTQYGSYVKIGQMVYAQFYAALSSKGTITTSVQIQGLPFTSFTTTGPAGIALLRFENLATNWVQVMANMEPTDTAATVKGATAAAATNTTNLTTTDINNNTVLSGLIIYRASA